LNERFAQIKEIHKNGGGLLDRSIFGDRIFAEMLAEDLEDGGEGMTWEEYRTYSKLLDSMLEHAQAPTLMIYLQCSTDTAIDRINKRDRGLESQVDRGYWDRLNTKYDEWYQDYDASPAICINVDDLDFVNNPEDREYVVQLIQLELLALGRIESFQTTIFGEPATVIRKGE
jgi:deoxyadenosine/deoxycytidine kinase